MILLQIIINRYVLFLKTSVDLLFLVLIYISIKGSFLQSIIGGTFIGLLTDCLVDGTLGIYGFSRTLSAFLVNEFSKYVDLKKTIFKFFIIAVSLSFSNGIALFFLSFTNSIDFNVNMIVYQPIMTAVIGIFILYWKTFREKLNVY